MIRFIDLTEQIYLDRTPCYAFFFTVTNTFLSFDNDQHWTTKEEFEDSYLTEKDKPNWDSDSPELNRFTNLIPKGFFRYYLNPH